MYYFKITLQYRNKKDEGIKHIFSLILISYFVFLFIIHYYNIMCNNKLLQFK